MDRKSYALIKKVEHTIEAHALLDHASCVLVGLSGGMDSVCLLSILRELSKQFSVKILAAHINHNLRGEDAAADEAFVRTLCEKWQVPLYVKSLDVAAYAISHGMSVEEAGRKVRYDYFEELCSHDPQMKIATAHHQNDQAETVLMRMLRGAGLFGLCGIPYQRGNVIRPLLDLTREEIRNYHDWQGLSHREDQSNYSAEYLRNRVRLNLVPELLNYNPNLIENLHQNTQFLQEDKELIAHMAEKAWKECLLSQNVNELILDKCALQNMPFAIFSRIFCRAIHFFDASLHISYDELKKWHKTIIQNEICQQKLDASLVFSFQDAEIVIKSYDNETMVNFCYELALNQPIFISEINWWVCLANSTKSDIINKSCVLIDGDLISHSLTVRSRLIADEFYPKGMDGKKSVKKYLTDQKIKKEAKNCVPIFLYDEKVVWIGGMRQDRRFVPNRDTKRLLKLQMWKG